MQAHQCQSLDITCASNLVAGILGFLQIDWVEWLQSHVTLISSDLLWPLPQKFCWLKSWWIWLKS